MTDQEIREGFTLISETSKNIKVFNTNLEALAEKLSSIPEKILKDLEGYYTRNKKGPLKDLRKEVVVYILSKGGITAKELENKIKKHRQNSNERLNLYKTNFSLFSHLINSEYSSLTDFTSKFIKQLVNDLELNEVVNNKIVDFAGSRQQGTDRFWFALYNKGQGSQSTSLQIFFNIEGDLVSYGLYKHKDKTYPLGKININPDEIDYKIILKNLETCKTKIINDIPSKSTEEILDLKGHSLYKISHAVFNDKKWRQFIEERSVISLYEDTNNGQAEAFRTELKKGDFVYITYGGNLLFAVARVTGDSWEYFDPDEMDGEEGWIYRDVEYIKMAVDPSLEDLKGYKSWHYPGANTALRKISAEHLEEINEVLFKPHFGID